MSFEVKYLDKLLSFNHPISVLDIVGDNPNYICCKVNNRIRELTYIIKDNAVLEIL